MDQLKGPIRAVASAARRFWNFRWVIFCVSSGFRGCLLMFVHFLQGELIGSGNGGGDGSGFMDATYNPERENERLARQHAQVWER